MAMIFIAMLFARRKAEELEYVNEGERCGWQNNNAICADGYCSIWGYCRTSDWFSRYCQPRASTSSCQDNDTCGDKDGIKRFCSGDRICSAGACGSSGISGCDADLSGPDSECGYSLSCGPYDELGSTESCPLVKPHCIPAEKGASYYGTYKDIVPENRQSTIQ
eukprot:NODE_458_length_7216_cov_0.728537.p4 type:complete len:164 gc:universal NODE_458_length_7216_cov_0.728537:3336-2845(-)